VHISKHTQFVRGLSATNSELSRQSVDGDSDIDVAENLLACHPP
jgi:hypothetical protein